MTTTRFSQAELRRFAIECAAKISNAKTNVEFFEEPFKHLVIDHFLPEVLARVCLENFPSVDDDSWERSNDENIEIKLRSTWKSEFDIPEGIVDAVRIMNCAPILKAMGERFEIPKMIPDAYFTGGGLNATVRGGLLDVHVDGNYHDATGLHRRTNALIYLNPGWQEGWGGEFGLYDAKGEECIKAVAPLYNRLVIFDSHDYSFHGLPNPLNFPEDDARRSIILYYYTKEPRPSHLISVEKPHSALWKKKGLKDKRGNTTRAYQ